MYTFIRRWFISRTNFRLLNDLEQAVQEQKEYERTSEIR